jgi:predicted O-methyltransferase YrrM
LAFLLLAQGVVAVDFWMLDSDFPWLSFWFFGSAALLLLVLIYRKLIINYTELKGITNNGFAQVEALFYLHSRLQLRRALPRMRSYGISPDFANVLVDLVLKRQPAVIVECGSGISTLVDGYLLEKQGRGHVYALEHDPDFALKTAEELARHGLQRWATVCHAALETFSIQEKEWKWYGKKAWESLPGIDLLVVDGPPSVIQAQARYPALPLLHDKMNPGSAILVDDCQRRDDREIVERWVREYPGWTLEWIPTEKNAALLIRE